ncbi:MAG: hypothetical protein DRI57_03835 [Deltaproteobacteria bacterium]|nr:MAG: hypothetical protein DRI57_03835 [Deltaproteobacteria bacterium]
MKNSRQCFIRLAGAFFYLCTLDHTDRISHHIPTDRSQAGSLCHFHIILDIMQVMMYATSQIRYF